MGLGGFATEPTSFMTGPTSLATKLEGFTTGLEGFATKLTSLAMGLEGFVTEPTSFAIGLTSFAAKLEGLVKTITSTLITINLLPKVFLHISLGTLYCLCFLCGGSSTLIIALNLAAC